MYDSDKGIDLPPQSRGMGYVGQEPALFPHLTVSKNIGFGLKDLNREERKARVAEMVEVFRLEGLEDRAPAHLSGGQKQRVALARALARHPRGLLLDEPFSALDLPLRNELWQVLCDVQSGFALPVVVVTHDPYEARAMADRIVVYSAGRTVRSGTPEQVMVRPDRPEIDTLLTGWGVSRVGVA
jgi:molybdate transport system ATP-binding protein